MPDTKPSAFTADATPDDADRFPFIDMDGGGAGVHQNKYATWADLKTAVNRKSLIRADVDRTLGNNTNVQALFGVPANGRLTIPTGVFIFELVAIVSAMSATSGNALIDIKGAGTATIGSWMWFLHGLDNTTPSTIGSDLAAFYQVGVTAASAVTAATGTAMRVRAKGMFECTTGGTLIPSIDLVTAAAAVVEEGSWFELEYIAPSGATSVGAWD